MPDFNFLLFGCWNYVPEEGANTKQEVARNNVLRYVQKHESKYGFVVVAGDNVYQRKRAKDKKNAPLEDASWRAHERDLIMNGFELLGASLKEKRKAHIILGNHNASTALPSEVQAAQMTRASRKLELHTYHRVLEHDNDAFNSCAKVLLINTNVLLCCDKKKKDSVEQQEQEQEQQKNIAHLCKFLQDNLSTDPDVWNIVVGHEPLISMKSKGGKPKTDLLCGLDAIMAVFAKFNNVVYMCADVHMFQAGTVVSSKSGHKVPMVVCGTGGAELDDPPVVPTTMNTNHKAAFPYHLDLSVTDKSHGFCSIWVSKERMRVTFKSITDRGGRVCLHDHIALRLNMNDADAQFKTLHRKLPTTLKCAHAS